MRTYADFHSHTKFSDGRDSMEKMAETAYEKGMYALGFSDHAERDFGLNEARIEAYKAEIVRIRKLYEGKIQIYAGVELDLFSEMPTDGLDYIVSSAHYLKHGDELLPVDWSGERTQEIVDKYYGGDIFAYTRDYYSEVSHLADRGPAVIGHFDLVTKFNEGGQMFDECDPKYLAPAMDAVEALAAKNAVFEINTGAIFRGHRSQPYPSLPLLRRMKELGGRFILAGDSHNADALCYQFAEAEAYAGLAGITEFEKYPPGRN